MIKQFRNTSYYCTPYGEIYRKLWDGRFKKLNPSKDKFGYRFLTILGGVGKVMKAHRVIYEAWHGPIPEGMTLDHVDFNKDNNSLLNLKMVTRSENSSRKQKRLSGTASPLAKLTDQQVLEIYTQRNCKRGYAYKIAEKYGITRSTVKRIFNKQSYTLLLKDEP